MFAIVVIAGVIGITLAGSNNSLSSMYLLLIVTLVAIVGLAFSVLRFWQLQEKRRNLRLLTLADVDTMSGLEFEAYVAELFRAQGYKVQMTPINDYGVDIILQKDSVRTAVQTKRYSKPVNQAAVREAVAGMLRYKCSKSMVVTNNTFTKSATELARSNLCRLIDREHLAQLAANAQR